MKLNEAQLKRIIAEETFVGLVEANRLNEAARYYIENRDIIDEGVFDRFVPIAFKGQKGWQNILDKIIADEEAAARMTPEQRIAALEKKLAEVEKLLAMATQSQTPGEDKSKQEHERDLKKANPNLDPETAAVVAQTLDAIDNNPATLKQAKAAAEKAGVEAPAGAAPDADDKPDTAAQTVKDVKDLIVNPAQRKLLLRGLFALLSNTSVERVLKRVQPPAASDALINFLGQISQMDPKVHAELFKKYGEELVASEIKKAQRAAKGKVTAGGTIGAKRVGRAAAEKKLAQQRKRLDPAGLATPQGRGPTSFDLQEASNKDLAEQIAAVEALSLYFERKCSNKR